MIGRRADVVIETTCRNPDYFAQQVRRYRDNSYRAEAAVLAVSEALSRLGVVSRYQDQIDARERGRRTPTGNHDASYRAIMQTAAAYALQRVAEPIGRRVHDLIAAIRRFADAYNDRWQPFV